MGEGRGVLRWWIRLLHLEDRADYLVDQLGELAKTNARAIDTNTRLAQKIVQLEGRITTLEAHLATHTRQAEDVLRDQFSDRDQHRWVMPPPYDKYASMPMTLDDPRNDPLHLRGPK